MNKTLLIGRLTRDPEVRYTQEQKCIARFTLAVDRATQQEGKQNADFISCIAFGKTAEFIEKYIVKGIKIGLDGHITTGSYTKQDGAKVYTTDVVAERVEFCEKKQDGATSKPAQADAEGFINVAEGLDDELPFE